MRATEKTGDRSAQEAAEIQSPGAKTAEVESLRSMLSLEGQRVKTAGTRQEDIGNAASVLADCEPSDEAKKAILTGDPGWISANIGELAQNQLMFIYQRLEHEAW